jgi:Zn finger protein HypA/HybF involved in hydrogenase expression
MESIVINQLKCVRCGHRWFPKPGSVRPKVCPACHSKAWDRRENLRIGRPRGVKNRQYEEVNNE